MRILGIDPGSEKSAYVVFDGEKIVEKGIVENHAFLFALDHTIFNKAAIEMVASYGMAVGRTVFETVFWIGRFYEVAGELNSELVYRKDIKIHFCGSMKAKDANIRQALIDRFGPPGTKKNPGVLYGVSKDIWSALAVAVYYYDLKFAHF